MNKPVLNHPAEQLFRIDSIAEAPAPEGKEGVWHSYVIMQGSNAITGLREGSLSEVSLRVEQMVERLNQRFTKQQAKARR